MTEPSQFVIAIEFLAVVVGALYGVLLAARQGMDVVGVFTVASVVAFGGGTLRDLFLGRYPLFWIGNPHYPVVVFVIALLAGLIVRYFKRIRPLLLFPDALGMGLFTMAGASIALDYHTTWFLAAILGTITGTFGGVLGDIVCNQIPSLFRPAPLQATCAFAGAWIFIFSMELELPENWAMVLGVVVIVLFRLAAVRWKWSFPSVREPAGHT